MKFLCVPCDRPMKLQAVAPPDRGSLSVVYTCPDCGYEIAMLTNPYETQLVQSLGVRVAPEAAGAGATTSAAVTAAMSGAGSAASAVPNQTAEGESAKTTKCPFAAMIPGSGQEPARDAENRPHIDDTVAVRWTAAAEARLENIPAFVRPMARTGIEKYARDNGCVEVDEKILDAARDFFGM